MANVPDSTPAPEPVPVVEKVWIVLVVAMLLFAASYGLVKLSPELHSSSPAPAPKASANRAAFLDAQAAPVNGRADGYFASQLPQRE